MKYTIEKKVTSEWRLGGVRVHLIGVRVRCFEGIGLWWGIFVQGKCIHCQWA